jgi:DNA sulfur modification protein DndB
MEKLFMLDPGMPVSSKAALAKIYKEKKKTYEYDTILPGSELPYLEQSWEVFASTKRKLRIRRLLPMFKIQENRFWCYLHDIGYKEFSPGENFNLPFEEEPGVKRHQIDVFAKDDETFVVVECKQRAKNQSMTNFLDMHSARHTEITNSVRKYYKDDLLKGIFIFVTDGIDWTLEDLDIARARNTHIVTTEHVDHFEENASQLKSLARYQFHSEFLEGEEISSFKDLKVGAVVTTIETPKGDMIAYQFSIPAKELIKICYVNRRSLRDRNTATSYQRNAGRARLESLRQYVVKGGYFPNNIILSLNEEEGKQHHFEQLGDLNVGALSLPAFHKALRVIDGQHRLYGSAAAESKNAMVLVVLLVNPASGEEIRLFRDINKEQKNVNASLLSDLESDINWGSDDAKQSLHALASRLALKIMTDPRSPYAGQKHMLTVAEVKKAVIHSELLGTYNTKTGSVDYGPFRGTDDYATLRNAMDFLFPYFTEIKNEIKGIWESKPQRDKAHGHPRSNVFVAGHLELIGRMLTHASEKNRNLRHSGTREQFLAIRPLLRDYIESIRDMSSEGYIREFKPVYGSGGGGFMLSKLALTIRRKNPEFTWPKLDKFVEDTAEDRVAQYVQRAKTLAKISMRLAVERLDDEFEGDFLSPKFASPDLLYAINKRIRKAGAVGDVDPRSYLEFPDLFRFIYSDQKFRRKLKFLAIPSSYTGAQRENDGWMNVVTTLISNSGVSMVDDEFKKVIEELEPHLLPEADDGEALMQTAA